MKKILMTIMTIAALSFMSAACTQGPTIEGTAKVRTETGQGSSFQIKQGRWLTAAHVTNGATEVKLVLNDGTEVTAKVAWEDKFRDVALLIAPVNARVEVIPLLCVVPVRGESVIHRGYPLGFPYGVYFGRVATDEFSDDRLTLWPKVQIVSITGGPGSSGGVIQNRGYAVGMLVGGVPATPTMIFSLTGKYLCDVVEWNEETQRLKKARPNGS